MPEPLTILAIADLHYIHHARPVESEAPRPYTMSLEWLWRAVRQAQRLARVDAIVLLGDLVDNGTLRGAELDLAEMSAQLRETGVPVIVVPGNHDADSQRVFAAFGDRPGKHVVKGYTLYSFDDPYAVDDTMRRPQEAIDRFLREPVEGPVIALQHSPVYPDVQYGDYPFMPLNRDVIMASYRQKGVRLSLSGHYHPGHPAVEKDGTTYAVCATLTKAPFSFYLVHVDDRGVRTERHELQYQTPGLVDWHIHSHFGYCAVDVNPRAVLERAEALGMGGVACVEHAGQLYLTKEEYWRHDHVEHPELLRKAREQDTDRLLAYRATMSAFRCDRLRVGLEVEVDQHGDLNLLPEDRAGWDVLLGAVHWVPERLPTKTPSECSKAFMAVTEQIIAQGIHILAHPFRFFHQRKMAAPPDLYPEVAKLLKKHGVAAEINYHINEPDPAFFKVCLDQGVLIVMGSDGHMLRSACDLHRHMRLLESIGVRREDIQRITRSF